MFGILYICLKEECKNEYKLVYDLEVYTYPRSMA